MKRCLSCQKDYPDNMSFCTLCGKPLSNAVQSGGTFCPGCGAQNPVTAKFCVKCGKILGGAGGPGQMRPNQPAGPGQMRQTPGTGQQNRQIGSNTGLNQGLNNTPINQQGQEKKSSLPLILGLVSLVVIIGIAAVVGVFLARNQNDKSDTVAKKASSSEVTSESGKKTEATEKPVKTEDAKGAAQEDDVSEYQDYYDKLDSKFKKYIMTTSANIKIDTYSNMLKDAITQKNATQCEAMKGKLDSLESQLKQNSQKKISTLKKKVASYEKKSYAKKTKSSAAYKKAKRKAKQYEASGNYASANIQYSECIDRIKEAKAAAKKKKKKKSSSSGDDMYALRKDDYTYQYLRDNYLSQSEVNALSEEMKQYYVNTISAWVGYIFHKKANVKKFFEYQDWYTGGWTTDNQAVADDLDNYYWGEPICSNYHMLLGK